MKKEILALFLLILIFPLALAQTQNNLTQSPKEAENSVNIQEATNEILTQELTISEAGDNLIRTALNIKPEENLTIEKIIVILCILIGLVVLIQGILVIIPFFEGNKSWAGAVIITLIIGVTGTIYSLVMFLFDFANIFDILENWSSLRIAFMVLVLFAFFYGVSILTKILKGEIEKEQAEHLGTIAGTEIKKLKIIHDVGKEYDKKPDFAYKQGMRRGGEKPTRSRFVSKNASERYARRYGNEAAKKRFENKKK